MFYTTKITYLFSFLSFLYTQQTYSAYKVPKLPLEKLASQQSTDFSSELPTASTKQYTRTMQNSTIHPSLQSALYILQETTRDQNHNIRLLVTLFSGIEQKVEQCNLRLTAIENAIISQKTTP